MSGVPRIFTQIQRILVQKTWIFGTMQLAASLVLKRKIERHF
jgi:hypothetical protein